MALGETFDLGRVIQTAEAIKGMRREEENDRLRNAYMGISMENAKQQGEFARAEEARKQTAFTQDQFWQNNRLINVAAKSVLADPSSAAQWLPELKKAGVVPQDFEIGTASPEQLQAVASKLAQQTDVALQARIRQDPQFATMDQNFQNQLKLVGEQHKNSLSEIAARGEQDRQTAAITAPGKLLKSVQLLRKEFESSDTVKNYRTVLPIINSARNAPDTGYGDLDLIYAAGKILDPGSVVREGELALTIAAGSPLQRILGSTRFSIEKGGRLTPESRQQLVGMLQGRVGALEDAYTQERERFSQYATEGGFDPNQVVGPAPKDAFKAPAGVDFIYTPGQPLKPAR